MRSMLEGSWPSLLAVTLLAEACCFPLAAWRRGGAFGPPRPDWAAWAIFVFLFGLPGYAWFLSGRTACWADPRRPPEVPRPRPPRPAGLRPVQTPVPSSSSARRRDLRLKDVYSSCTKHGPGDRGQRAARVADARRPGAFRFLGLTCSRAAPATGTTSSADPGLAARVGDPCPTSPSFRMDPGMMYGIHRVSRWRSPGVPPVRL